LVLPSRLVFGSLPHELLSFGLPSPRTFHKIFYHIFLAMKDQPSPEVKDQAFAEFRSDIDKAIDHGVEDHETSMTKMGFLFLGIFVGVIALAAVLP
jgi:hypothetical protein